MVPTAEISGSGIAAQACSTILWRFGWAVNRPEPGPTPVPYLVINSVTASLINDVFGVATQSLGGYEISRRLIINHWDNRVSQVNEPVVAVSAASLKSLAGMDSGLCPLRVDGAWRVFAGEQPPEGHLVTSGNRMGWIFDATSRGNFGSNMAIFEFIPEGWLFWAPLSIRKGFLQLVLPRAQENVTEACRLALKRTRVLKRVVEPGECTAGPLPCAAAMHNQLIGPDWIATGTSALRYDPISGDGTGASLRSAILAVATLRGLAERTEHQRYLNHYVCRLKRAFQQHIRICEALYARGKLSSVWDEEICHLQQLRLKDHVLGITAPSLRLLNYSLADG